MVLLSLARCFEQFLRLGKAPVVRRHDLHDRFEALLEQELGRSWAWRPRKCVHDRRIPQRALHASRDQASKSCSSKLSRTSHLAELSYSCRKYGKDNDAMTARSSEAYHFYPAKYFSVSRTNFVWNALTAHDVHNTLLTRPGFEGQNLYFILNHPIKFVQLVGLVVDVELLGNGKYLILTIDEGSGSTIECKAEVRQLTRPNEQEPLGKVKEEWPSNTHVNNLNVNVDLGSPKVTIDGHLIDIGTVLKAKGTIDTFRSQRQLKLERVRIVKDTNEEVKAWQETANWKADVLSKPWVLTEAQKREVDVELERERVVEIEKSRVKKVKDAEHARKKRKYEERKEGKRRVLEGEFDKGALVRSGVLPERATDS